MDAMATNKVFAYGTLMNPEVVEYLLNKVPVFTPGVLMGWKKFSVPGSPYFLLADEDAAVQGLILHDLNILDMVALDQYENVSGKLYERKFDKITTDNMSTKAFFYVAGEMFLQELNRCGYLASWGYDLIENPKSQVASAP